jgi:hypothetical protein
MINNTPRQGLLARRYSDTDFGIAGPRGQARPC